MKPNLADKTCELLKWLCNYRKLHNTTTREQFWQYSLWALILSKMMRLALVALIRSLALFSWLVNGRGAADRFIISSTRLHSRSTRWLHRVIDRRLDVLLCRSSVRDRWVRSVRQPARLSARPTPFQLRRVQTATYIGSIQHHAADVQRPRLVRISSRSWRRISRLQVGMWCMQLRLIT